MDDTIIHPNVKFSYSFMVQPNTIIHKHSGMVAPDAAGYAPDHENGLSRNRKDQTMIQIQARLTKGLCNWNLLVVFSLCCILFTGRQALAQLDQGTITGVVQDSGGGVIPGAQVTLTNVDTGLVLQTKTDGSGIYIFSPVKIGNFTASATAPGFETTSQTNIHLDVQERLNVVVVLRPGAVTETVTVSSAPPLLQSQSGSVGQVLSTEMINDTPLNGRNWVYIAQLTAGVDPANGSRGNGTGDFNANGQRAEQNNFILDGVDNNTNAVDFLNGASFVVRPPPDALAEFKVDTSDYSAEFGHSAGAVVNASIKSGTNQIHGDLWEYLRNDVLDARDWNAPSISKYRENQFGATLGLPIISNKLFFFGDAEANRIVFGETNTLTVPTPLMRQGNFTELLNPGLTGQSQAIQLYQPNSGGGTTGTTLQCQGQNNVFCGNQIDTVAQGLLNLFPLPNTNSGLTYNNYVVNRNSTDNTFQWDTRMDWNISSHDQSFARYSYSHELSYRPSPLGPILDGGNFGDDGNTSNLGENFAFSETHFFNPNLSNEFRFGYTYGHFLFLQPNYNVDLSPTLGLGGIPFGAGYPQNGGLAYFSVAGVSQFGSPQSYPANERQNVYQILDNVTKIVGNHSLKAGFNLQSIRSATLEPCCSKGSFSYTGLYTSNLAASFTGYGVADFLADQNNSSSIGNEVATNDVRWYRAAYFEDDWRLNTRLTLNLGLRYDYFQPYKENSDQQATYHVTGPLGIGTGSAVYQIPVQKSNVPMPAAFTSILAKDNIALQYVNSQSLVKSQKKNFAPRIGFAYQIDPRTVVRGAYGIFYGGLENIGYYANLSENLPFQVIDTFNAPNCAPGNCSALGETLETGFSQALAVGLNNFVSFPSLRGTDAVAKTPYTEDYNLTIEHSFSSNLVASIGYVGNESRHLQVQPDPDNYEALVNPSVNPQFTRPFPDIGGTAYIAYAGVSTYNGLQTKLERRYANGWSALATYTWSHALDDATTPLGSNGDFGFRNNNLIPILDEYSNSPWDTRQRVTLTGLYALPFGRGRTHLNRGGIADLVIGGWSSDLTFVAQSGQPFTVSPNITSAAGAFANAVLIRNPFAPGGVPDPSNPGVECAASTRNKTNWYNPCAFANPLPGSNIPVSGPGSEVTGLAQVLQYLGGRRNQISGPGYNRLNMSIFKDVTTFREQRLQFRTDIFNVLNTPSYANPSVTNNNTNGGQITSAKLFQNLTPDARFFQLSLKYIF
jgi:hypothetical protein